jgi:hypothetical protein
VQVELDWFKSRRWVLEISEQDARQVAASVRLLSAGISPTRHVHVNMPTF